MAKKKVANKTTKAESKEEKQPKPQEIKKQLEVSINKHYGYPVMITDSAELEVRKIKTGVFSIDFETGGGVPKGRGIIYVGEESTFKSTLLYMTGGNFQRCCGNCVVGTVKEVDFQKTTFLFEQKDNDNLHFDAKQNKYFAKKYFASLNRKNLYCPNEEVKVPKTKQLTVFQYDLQCDTCKNGEYSLFGLLDNEHNYTKKWASKFDVVNYYTMVAQAESSEQTGELLREWMKTGRLSFIGVDSVDALGPIVEDENAISDQQMGVQARVWNKITRSIHGLLNKPFAYKYIDLNGNKVDFQKRPNPTICLISQYREKIGAYGDPRVSGAGRGKSFLSSLTIDLRKGERDYEKIDNKKVYANYQKFVFELIKNKVGVPFRLGEIHFDLKTLTVNNIYAYIDYGIKFGIIKKAGSWFEYGGKSYQGKSQLANALEQNKQIRKQLYSELMRKANEKSKKRKTTVQPNKK